MSSAKPILTYSTAQSSTCHTALCAPAADGDDEAAAAAAAAAACRVRCEGGQGQGAAPRHAQRQQVPGHQAVSPAALRYRRHLKSIQQSAVIKLKCIMESTMKCS
jgi:hypothetical protein